MARKSNNTALNAIASSNNSGLLDNKLSKEITYTTSNTGKIGTTILATVTGVVSLSIFAVCSEDIVGDTATIEVGTTLNSDGIIPQTIATDIISNEIWHDATPDSSIELSSVISKNIVTNDIIQTIATAPISSGKLKYYILWSPISEDGNVTI